MAYLKGFRLQKKYIAFLTVVPLLTVTALVNVTCPVCEGDGFVTSGWNMEQVRLDDIQSKEEAVLRHACDMFLMYEYTVWLSLSNDASEEAVGWIKMVLVDFTEGRPLATLYVVVEIPGQTTLDIAYNVWFSTALDEELITEVKAEVITGEIEDVTCNGTGRVSLNSLPLINSLESKLKETARVEKPFAPPLIWWDEE